ncbi:MAG: sulfatase [Saprospiraceae bacterium]|nr:sulfatase [Saprospiraceae bacterium]
MKELLFIILVISACSCSNKNEVIEGRPNILFILADDLGYSDLSCMGSKYYETPNIDAIADNGMVFTDGYAGCQVCSPSRATIMTGQFASRHGITDWIGAPTGINWQEKKKRNNKVVPPAYNHYMASEAITLPEALKLSGYSTFFAGKWHLGEQGNLPTDHGFDINKGGWDKGSPAGGFFSPFKNPYLENQEPGENLSMRLAKETSDFIRASKDSPFLAFLSFYAVHAPIQTTKEKWSKYRNKAERMGIADQGFEDGYFLPMRKHQDNPVYAGLIESMDDAVGEVLNTLYETGLNKNTIVIFTSDNGGVTSGDNYSTNCLPLKGGKGYEWEGGIRIPYIVSVPWMDHQGYRNNTPVAGSDFYPTILELAGLPLHNDDHLDGKSIVPLLNGNLLEDRPLIWHYPHYGNQGGRPVSIIRKGDWKLIHFWEDGHHELYNLPEDIHEDNDLSARHPDRAESMSVQLMRHLEESGAKIPTHDPNYSQEQEQATIIKMKANAIKRYGTLRKEMLKKDWEPNENWWGSIPTVD